MSNTVEIGQWHPHAETFPRLEGEGYDAFRDDIRRHGQRETVKYRMVNGVRQGLDGRNRTRACKEIGIECRCEKVLIEEADVKAYIDSLNLHRRHLTLEQQSYARGTEYNAAKKPRGGDRRKEDTNGRTPKVHCEPLVPDSEGSKSTAEALADKHGVAPSTIKRDGEFAQAVDTIAATDPAAKEEILAGTSGMSKAEVVELAAPPAEPEPAKDGAGIVIPPVAAIAFDAQGEFGSVCHALDGAVARVKEIGDGPAGRLTNVPSVVQTIQSARKTLWQSRPTHVCPYCLGEPQKPVCNCCKGQGWTNTATWKQSPVGRKADGEQ